jgi:hypothetical protein
MACNACEASFQAGMPIAITINTSGPNALLYVSNQGLNIALIRQIVVCYEEPNGDSGFLVLRAPPEAISWIYPSTYLDANFSALYYEFTKLPAGTLLQAQADYIEITGRSRSCSATTQVIK